MGTRSNSRTSSWHKKPCLALENSFSKRGFGFAIYSISASDGAKSISTLTPIPRSFIRTILRRIRLPFLIRLTSRRDSIWMSKLHRIESLLDSACSPIDLSWALPEVTSDFSAPRMRIESFRKLTGHSIVVSDSVGAGGCTMPPSINAYRWASIAVVTSELAPMILSIGRPPLRLPG